MQTKSVKNGKFKEKGKPIVLSFVLKNNIETY